MESHCLEGTGNDFCFLHLSDLGLSGAVADDLIFCFSLSFSDFLLSCSRRDGNGVDSHAEKEEPLPKAPASNKQKGVVEEDANADAEAEAQDGHDYSSEDGDGYADEDGDGDVDKGEEDLDEGDGEAYEDEENDEYVGEDDEDDDDDGEDDEEQPPPQKRRK
ncbi:hypothetical protein KP509_01G121600 [Ceratopteris richardii]|uniref:Uncharacterized protein n=1 Tax=Ceratopteris richardii TaxID=49495 RepID=A0A8T2VGZ2_CERRI|nr:hypothetical protein KP509_01G121600 [Ceratopteris richardii]